MIDKIAWLHLRDGKILVARTKGRSKYYIPGGKREVGETDLQTLIREIKEELSVDISPETVQFYGIFIAQADSHATGIKVKMTCYLAEFKGEIQPATEIESIKFADNSNLDQVSFVDNLIFADLRAKGLLD